MTTDGLRGQERKPTISPHVLHMEILNWLREKETEANVSGVPLSVEELATQCAVLALSLLRAPTQEERNPVGTVQGDTIIQGQCYNILRVDTLLPPGTKVYTT